LSAAAILAGGLALVWPAFLNGYPLLFVDSSTYLRQTTEGIPPWDKSFTYGLAAHALHWQWSLWPVVLAVGIAASWLLWLAQRAVRGAASPAAQLLLCAAVAALTSAPWFLASVMPDALTGLGPLALFLLGFGRLSRPETIAVGLLAALAISVHMAHLPSALALVLLTGLLTRRLAPTLRVAAPLALVLAVLTGGNALLYGRATPSPHGAIFLLARLQDDGPALWVLRDRCPQEPGWRLCHFLDRLPMDAEDFLWGISPINSELDGSLREDGGRRAVPEARAILAATLAEHPWAVAAAMLRNTLRQLGLFAVGDTLVGTSLGSTREVIARGFPPGELARFEAGLQAQAALHRVAAPFLILHQPVLLAALLLLPLLLWRAAHARDLARAALLLFAMAAIGSGAVATGALSKPLDRYAARIVWLLPAAVLLALPRRGPMAASPTPPGGETSALHRHRRPVTAKRAAQESKAARSRPRSPSGAASARAAAPPPALPPCAGTSRRRRARAPPCPAEQGRVPPRAPAPPAPERRPRHAAGSAHGHGTPPARPRHRHRPRPRAPCCAPR
jgi:hypothetical protein